MTHQYLPPKMVDVVDRAVHLFRVNRFEHAFVDRKMLDKHYPQLVVSQTGNDEITLSFLTYKQEVESRAAYIARVMEFYKSCLGSASILNSIVNMRTSGYGHVMYIHHNDDRDYISFISEEDAAEEAGFHYDSLMKSLKKENTEDA